jgi:molybdopterin-guanine dinucleotide biosynthesis protein A
MGRDKALLPWAGATTLLDHTLDRLRRACPDVRILCGPEPRYHDRGLPIVLDATPDGGPLAGVCAGLASAPGQMGLFLAVDVPFVPVAMLERLLQLAADVDAVLPVGGDGAHPLCAAYGPACLEPIQRRLAAGERKMTCFLPDVRVREMGPAELSAFGDLDALLRNVNTPEDYQSAR